MDGARADATVIPARRRSPPRPAIASGGGQSGRQTIRANSGPNEKFGITGAIVGRALYDGRVTVPDAIPRPEGRKADKMKIPTPSPASTMARTAAS